MYQEEYLPKENAYDLEIEDEAVSITVSSDDDSHIILSKFNTQFKKQQDPGYLKQKYMINNELKTIETFASKLNCNAKIRNAITGHRTFHHVGSPSDSKYFSVMDTTSKSNEPRKLYFDTPEQFERHYIVTVSNDIKNAWRNRNCLV